MACGVKSLDVSSRHVMLRFVLLRHQIIQSFSQSHYVRSSWGKLCHESRSIPTLPSLIHSDAADGNYAGRQAGTRSPLICPVEAIIPLLCEGAGAPGRSSSLPAAGRQSSLFFDQLLKWKLTWRNLVWFPGGVTAAVTDQRLSRCKDEEERFHRELPVDYL